jgi:staphylococcal nuclease domain-containing protein 1
VFKVDYTVEAIGNREFGSVFLGQENVALTVISSGWAKVGPQCCCWMPCIRV